MYYGFYVTLFVVKKRSAVRSRILLKPIFASCVGCFGRAYSGFYVTSLFIKMSAVRSRISSKLNFASCVGFFDHAYDGFCVTSSKMLYDLRKYWLACITVS